MLKRNAYYPLADRLLYATREETVRRFALAEEIRTEGSIGRDGWISRHVKAKWTGEKRPPKRGEWYLSGAEIAAYCAPNDLTTPYHIATLVVVREKKIVTITEVGGVP
jgi:hypothetical protein